MKLDWRMFVAGAIVGALVFYTVETYVLKPRTV